MRPLEDEIQQTKPFSNLEVEVYLNLLRTSDSLLQEIDKVLKVMGLDHFQYNILRILRGSKSTGLTQHKIFERMVIKNHSLPIYLKQLNSRGLIALTVNERKEEETIAQITNQGLDLVATLENSVNQKIVSLLSFLGTDLLEQFNALLTLSRKNISSK